MATAEQLKLLVKAHYENDYTRFDTLLIQVAASEAQKGHVALARDLKSLIEKGKKNSSKIQYIDPEIEGLITVRSSTYRLADLVVSKDVKDNLVNVIKEYENRTKLAQFGLMNRRKILLAGKPGTGKTLTASVLATELQLPLCIIHTDKIMTKYLGETSQKLSKIFDYMANFEAIYLFDEFDSIASERNFNNDVGEIRRIINSFLQYIESNDSGFIIGATNNPQLLDSAIFRRFDDVIIYKLPDAAQRKKLIKNTLGQFWNSEIDLIQVGKISEGLNHAEIVNVCKDAIKETILSDLERVNENVLIKNIDKKIKTYSWEK
ncbi:ATP-binding protein [Metasolibacillus meyeri]|uniref:ATP-binding protein n=1 Tax=Metasolibacillus meyeri TaxID=1071052 RepID=A0AAW9NML7_9BACL|nr:ATP-binding protein [Metasolibacillus meyeri]MEC1178635.1 ATP-binding protein [Metasolibacillus meyeri]